MNVQENVLLDKIKSLKPHNVLDVGCGGGSFTVRLSTLCEKVTAIDSSARLINRCKEENQRPNIRYACIDARKMPYAHDNFDVVLARACLHHVQEWKKVLDEMVRVSSKYILIEEPIYDPRSEEKRITLHAHKFFLKLQHEVGYPHYEYRTPQLIIQYFQGKNIHHEYQIVKLDTPIDFDEFFESFAYFAERTRRKDYWFKRLENLRSELNDKKLCEDDIVFVFATK